MPRRGARLQACRVATLGDISAPKMGLGPYSVRHSDLRITEQRWVTQERPKQIFMAVFINAVSSLKRTLREKKNRGRHQASAGK